MRTVKMIGLALAVAFAAPMFAAQAVSQPFLGEWTATVATPGGAISETLKVEKTDHGYAVTGKLVVPDPSGNPEAGPGTDIVLNGDSFSYKRAVAIAGGTIVITYSGTVSGDTFTGTVDMGFAKAPYTGVRVKSRS